MASHEQQRPRPRHFERAAKIIAIFLIGLAVCLQAPSAVCQDAIPVTANNSWAKPLLIVPPELPKGPASSAQITVEGTVTVDGKLISPELSPLGGTETHVQAIKEVIKYWRFRPAIDFERCKPKESRQILKVYFELMDGKPSISISSPVAEKGVDALSGRKPTRLPKIVYPDAAIRGEIEGFVELLLQVDGDGQVLSKEVISSMPNRLFGEAAMEALRTTRYTKLESGESKPVCSTVEVKFCLRDSPTPLRFPDPHCADKPSAPP